MNKTLCLTDTFLFAIHRKTVKRIILNFITGILHNVEYNIGHLWGIFPPPWNKTAVIQIQPCFHQLEPCLLTLNWDKSMIVSPLKFSGKNRWWGMTQICNTFINKNQNHRHAAGVSHPTTTHTACSRISTRSCSLCCCHEYCQLVLGNLHT